MNLTPEMLLLFGSLMTAACVATGMMWLKSAWNALADRQIAAQLARARQLEVDPSTVMILNRLRFPVIIAVIVILGVVLRNYALAAAAVYLCWMAPVLAMDHMTQQRMILLRDQMVEAVVTLANSARASMDLAQGLRRVAEDTPEPLAGEFRRIVRDLDAGRVFRETIRDARTRLNLDSFTLFSGAILAAEEAGGPLNQTLENISRSLQENQRLERKLDAQTATGRAVVTTLAAAPVVFLVGGYCMFPEGTALVFTTGIGQIVLFVSFALVAVGVAWSRRILAAAGG